MKTMCSRCVVVLSVCLLAVLGFSSSASASHNRATQISWTKGAAPGEVNFTVTFVARRSYYGSPNVGESIFDPILEFGDGSSVTPGLEITEIDGDIIYTQAQVNHTYSGAGPFTATMGSCCRISSSSGHVNNGDLSYEVHTLVNPAKASSSPSIAVAPIVYCPTSGSCSFAFSGSSADPGNHLKWRFATPEESGDSLFVQPGPPAAPNAATIDASLGRITWDTTGATNNGESLPTYYSTQVVAEEVNSAGETVSDATADFFIALDDDHSEQPHCDDTDLNGSVDNDNDGLCDNWEESGIDSDHDEDIDFFLPTSADPDEPDIFIEIDYMRDREPQAAALGDVETAFAKHGIDLHLLVDDEIPFTDYLTFGNACSPDCADTSDFDEIKHVYFGTAGDRIASNWLARREARKFVFHYAIYADELLGTGSSGRAELPGNDLAITLGSFRTPGFFGDGPPTRRNEAGTFMHELGHNLALQHGGGDGVNCKPNYLSVMNYTRQTEGMITAQLDYSDAVLPTLDEDDLNEFLGIQGPGGAQVVHGPGKGTPAASSTGAIDWNRDGSFQSSLAADVNSISNKPRCSDPSPGEDLIGFDDWENLALAFQATSDFADGVHSSVTLQEPELSSEEFVDEDADGDGVPNLVDVCPWVAGSPLYGGCPPPQGDAPPSAPSGGAAAQPVGSPRPGAPDTRLRKARVNRRKASVRFTFEALGGASGVRFECRLDRKPYRPCRSPKTYANLKSGRHVFRVRAVDSLGQLDLVPVVKRFKIE